MRTTLLVLLLLASAASASDSVWRWTDSDGVTHYSDRPVPGATRVELRTINQMNTSGTTPPPTSATDTSPAPAVAESYRAFAISSPVAEQAIINTGGQVTIALRVDPALRPGHTISVLLNGQPVSGSPGAGLQYMAQGVPRGEHTITAVINDQSNQPVASAPSVRFYVRQPIARESRSRTNATPQGPNLPRR